MGRDRWARERESAHIGESHNELTELRRAIAELQAENRELAEKGSRLYHWLLELREH